MANLVSRLMPAMHSYSQVKRDVAGLAAEIVSLGGTLAGGFGRAEVEYWLESSVLPEAYPTPIELKLAAALAICSLKKEAGLTVEPEDEAAVQLLAQMLSTSTCKQAFAPQDVEAMQSDAMATLSLEARNAISSLLASSGV